MANKFIMAFNARSQLMEKHVVTIDSDGEYVFTAEDKSFFKLPGNLTRDQIDEALENHYNSNLGQVKVEDIEAKQNEKLDVLSDLFIEESVDTTPVQE